MDIKYIYIYIYTVRVNCSSKYIYFCVYFKMSDISEDCFWMRSDMK